MPNKNLKEAKLSTSCVAYKPNKTQQIGPVMFLLGLMFVVVSGYIAFARHTDPSHDPRMSSQATARIQIVDTAWEQSYAVTGGPGHDSRFICKIVQFATGAVNYAIFYLSNSGGAYIAVYNNEGWLSAYEGTTPNDFLNAQHRGMRTSKVINCDDFYPPSPGMIAP